MRLKEFRELTKDYPDDVILDRIGLVRYLPAFYDGIPYDVGTDPVNGFTIKVCQESKLVFSIFTIEELVWDKIDSDFSKEDNYNNVLASFDIENITDLYKKEFFQSTLQKTFEKVWIEFMMVPSEGIRYRKRIVLEG